MKRLARVKFTNGSKYSVYLPKRLPKMAREAKDYLYLVIEPEEGRGEKTGFYMNIYDMNNLIWVLSTAILDAQELGLEDGVEVVKQRAMK